MPMMMTAQEEAFCAERPKLLLVGEVRTEGRREQSGVARNRIAAFPMETGEEEGACMPFLSSCIVCI